MNIGSSSAASVCGFYDRLINMLRSHQSGLGGNMSNSLKTQKG